MVVVFVVVVVVVEAVKTTMLLRTACNLCSGLLLYQIRDRAFHETLKQGLITRSVRKAGMTSGLSQLIHDRMEFGTGVQGTFNLNPA